MLGTAVKKWREEKKLSQPELAQLAQTTQATISRIEAGEQTPSIELFKRIAHVVDAPAADVLTLLGYDPRLVQVAAEAGGIYSPVGS